MIATGRVPNTKDIGLEKLGVQLDSLGYISVNEKLETTAPGVWAMGDCAGTPQFTHAAYGDFRVVPYRLAKMPASAVLRTRTISEPRGFIKMLVATESDQILGFSAFCVEASELLAAVQTAMVGSLPYTVLRDAIYTHPTMSEAFVFFLSDVPPQVYKETKTRNG